MKRLTHHESFELMVSAIPEPVHIIKVTDSIGNLGEVYSYQEGKYWYAGYTGKIEVRATTRCAALAKLRQEVGCFRQIGA